MSNINFNGRRLTIGNSLSHEFKADIKDIKIYPSSIIVLLKRTKVNKNVFAVDFKGNILWEKGKNESNSSCVGLTKTNDEILTLHYWDGTFKKINVQTSIELDNKANNRPW